MYAVERLGSYISRGVYTVSGPFHPFGGAVDIIVVQQQDGSFKSSPWYVRFGKFQGVLKTREKVVNISVNGVESAFHMYLDHKGEAYFLRESNVGEGKYFMSPPSSGDETDVGQKDGKFKKIQSCNFEGNQRGLVAQIDMNNGKIGRTNSKQARILGLMFGRRSIREDENGGVVQRVSSLERAEMAADLLEVKWSTNLRTNEQRRNSSLETAVGSKEVDPSTTDEGGSSEMLLSQDGISLDEIDNSPGQVIGDSSATADVCRGHFEETATHNSPFLIADEDGVQIHTSEMTEVADKDRLIADPAILSRVEHDLVLETPTNLSNNMCGYGSGLNVSNKLPSPIAEVMDDRSGNDILNRDRSEEAGGHTQCSRANEGVLETRNLKTSYSAANSELISDVVTVVNDGLDVAQPVQGLRSFCDGVGEKSEVHDGPFETSEPASRETTIACGNDICRNEENQDEWHHGNLGVSSVDGSLAIRIPQDGCPSYEQDLQCSVADSCNLGDEFQAKFLGNATNANKSCISSSVILTQEFPNFRPLETMGARCSSSESLEDEQFLLNIIDRNHRNALEGYEVSRSHIKPIDIPRSKMRVIETGLLTKSLPNMRSHIHELEQYNHTHLLSCSRNGNSQECNPGVLNKESVSSLKSEVCSDSNTAEAQLTFEATTISCDAESGEEQKGTGADAACQASDVEKEQILDPQGMIAVDGTEKIPEGDTPGGSWNMWPFGPKKSESFNTVLSVPEAGFGKDVYSTTESTKDLTIDTEMQKSKNMKKLVRSLTPTSEELASLNLQEGRNVITFTFSTAMLGRQQVDARIYLWKWNSRIVISDVDGTITRSDVLGQFMPLVGVDWSQTGVAHLFSAIKENGYQLLFLSARAISQASLTRHFLFNLKQNGKVLPDGPVIISPDGLVPSLYREVIRRAPHEFKISCLEDIKNLFLPGNCHPFYAGFGNRDTDEISYLKVGIPKGKIFIINPKGEVAVNRRVDTKSYTSLHSLVNGMFPVMPSAEQEDYNSWNFWKLPLLDFDLKP